MRLGATVLTFAVAGSIALAFHAHRGRTWNAPAPEGLPANPVKARAAALMRPDRAVMRLDELGLFRVGLRRDGSDEQEMPVGWVGHFDEETGISCQAFGEQGTRRAWLLHCPWRGRTGVAFQEFVFRNPMTRRIIVRGATAMKTEYAEQSDGAAFRVYVNGRKLMDRHQTDSQWRPFSFELRNIKSDLVTVRFETDPGPDRNPSFDYSLWADRCVIFEGLPNLQVRQPEPPELDLARMVNTARQGVAPTSGFAGRTRTSVSGSTARLRYEGADGVVEYVWNTSDGDLGRIRLHAAPRRGRACSLAVAHGARMRWVGPASPQGTDVRVQGNRVVCEKRFRVNADTVTLELVASLIGKALAIEVSSSAPLAEALYGGAWGPVMRRTEISVPYYGTVLYARQEGLFLNTYLDWTASNASAHAGMLATYGALTDGSRQPLRETLVFAPAWHLAEVLPNIPNTPSPYRREVGKRIVLDVWGGKYEDIATHLEALHRVGITNCTVLIHDWQRSGYDNALPAHLPAAADKGGDDGMKLLVAAATRLGYLIALHENYVDYYPNYDHFDEQHIALDPSRSSRTRSYPSPRPSRPKSSGATARTRVTSTCTRLCRRGSMWTIGPVRSGPVRSRGFARPIASCSRTNGGHTAGRCSAKATATGTGAECSTESRPSSALAGPPMQGFVRR